MITNRYLDAVRLSDPVPQDSYLASLPVVRDLARRGELPFPGPVTFLVGENGSGKSTLLEAIAVACGFNAEGGTRNFNFSTRATHSELWKHLTVIRSRYPRDGFFLRAESFYNLASTVDDLDADGSLKAWYGGRSLHAQSHGESFLSLVANRMGGHGLYLFDEPEAALSPTGQMTLLAQMHALVQADSQLVIATHSPILMAYPGAVIYQLCESGMEAVPYEEIDHVRLTRYFLNHPEEMLRRILDQ